VAFAASAAVISRAAISQVRGLGQPRPASLALSGGAIASAGRTWRNAATRDLLSGSPAVQPAGSSGTGGGAQPLASPSAMPRGDVSQLR
jgi:hypothetical protein